MNNPLNLPIPTTVEAGTQRLEALITAAQTGPLTILEQYEMAGLMRWETNRREQQRRTLGGQTNALNKVRGQLATALAGADRVRQLHARTRSDTCQHCAGMDYPDYDTPWPCPTILALHPDGVPE